MRAVSEAQATAARGGGVPEPEEIAPGLWSVAVPMPGELLAYSLSVVHVGPTGEATIVDPGWPSAEGRDRLLRVLTSLGAGLGGLRSIVVTHAHPDHIGAAEELRRETGARVFLHEREDAGLDALREGVAVDPAPIVAGWGVPASEQDRLVAQIDRLGRGFVPPAPADVLLRDGDRLPIPGFACEVLATPGHTPGHVCLVDSDRGLLFSGDHVLPTLFPGVGLGVGASGDGDPVADTLASLDRLAPYDAFEVVPGHGYRFRGLGERRREMADHLRRRAAEVAEVLAEDADATVWRIAGRLTWSAGWERLAASPQAASALHQTELYRAHARSGRGRRGAVR